MTTLTRRMDLFQLYLSRTMALLVGVCALSVFLYVVFLMLAVEHTASRSASREHMDALTVEVSALETSYLQDMEKITPSRATELGFVTATDVVPVYAGDARAPLSLQ